jgi:hypothetical protein
VAQGRVTLLDAGGDAAQAVAALDELVRLSRLDPDWSWRRCAVIARDWRRLEPVRAYAEALGITIDMANEKPLSLWRMREMQGFVRTLLADRTRLLAISDLVAILNAQPQSRWTDLIGEGIGTLARELVDLSYAGRLRLGDPSLAAIATARPGDPVQLIRDGDRWRIDNAQGQTLARLSRAFAPPEGTAFLRGEVAAILNWRREDGDEEYNHLLRRDQWEVVLPELVFEAEAQLACFA